MADKELKPQRRNGVILETIPNLVDEPKEERPESKLLNELLDVGKG